MRVTKEGNQVFVNGDLRNIAIGMLNSIDGDMDYKPQVQASVRFEKHREIFDFAGYHFTKTKCKVVLVRISKSNFQYWPPYMISIYLYEFLEELEESEVKIQNSNTLSNIFFKMKS